MIEEADLLPVSAISQLVFCERRWALIHLERLWEENEYTAEGKILHERVDEGGGEFRQGVRVERGVPLRSLRLGLTGRADLVEFPPPPAPPFPVEYKRGKPNPGLSDPAQLCAQALCLEEMMGVAIPSGALFYHQTRRRQIVRFTPELRSLAEWAAVRIHELTRLGSTPPGKYERKCRGCSLFDLCLPHAIHKEKSAVAWLEGFLRSACGEE